MISHVRLVNVPLKNYLNYILLQKKKGKKSQFTCLNLSNYKKILHENFIFFFGL